MHKNDKMRTHLMAQQCKMLATSHLPKFLQITWLALVCINYSNGKPTGKFFLHHLGYLIAAFLMVATAIAHQGFYQVCVNVAFRNYET